MVPVNTSYNDIPKKQEYCNTLKSLLVFLASFSLLFPCYIFPLFLLLAP